MRATADNPNITLTPSVLKLIPKLAFEPCTDNEHSESSVHLSLHHCGLGEMCTEQEEMFYQFRQTLSIPTLIQQLCPSWIDIIMHTKYNNIQHQSSCLNAGKHGSILENITRNGIPSISVFAVQSTIYSIFKQLQQMKKKKILQ